MSWKFKPNRPLASVWYALAGIKSIAAIVCLLLAADAATAASPSNPPDDADAATRVAEGRALYRGSHPFSQPPTLHGVALVGAANACAACHGARGEAGTEAGVAVPPIAWQRLMQATASRPAYADLAQVLLALADGRASDGRSLAAPMPRFALTPREQRSLAAYLGVLGTEADPVTGVDAQRVVLGSVLPLTGRQAAIGAAIRGALQQRIDRINVAGGVFGRRLELVVADAGPDATSAAAAVDALARSGRVFALVASLVPAPDAALRRTLAATDTAMIAMLGVPVAPSSDPRISWLLPSLAQQARALEAELRRACPAAADSATRVLYLRDGALGPAAIGLPGAQWQAVSDLASVRAALLPPRPARTIVLLPAPLAEVARGALVTAGGGAPVACLGMLAALSGEVAGDVPGVRVLVALPMPPVALDEGADTNATLWPLLADSALAVATEAMARAGRQLDTAKLVAALDTVHGFAPRPGLLLDFSRQRRHGFDVSYLWKEGSP